MPWIDIVIIAVVAIIFGLAVGLTIHRRRKGGCGCGCNGCPYHGGCEMEPSHFKSK